MTHSLWLGVIFLCSLVFVLDLTQQSSAELRADPQPSCVGTLRVRIKVGRCSDRLCACSGAEMMGCCDIQLSFLNFSQQADS